MAKMIFPFRSPTSRGPCPGCWYGHGGRYQRCLLRVAEAACPRLGIETRPSGPPADRGQLASPRRGPTKSLPGSGRPVWVPTRLWRTPRRSVPARRRRLRQKLQIVSHWDIRCIVMPRDGARAAMYAELVSVSSPMRSSVPMESISPLTVSMLQARAQRRTDAASVARLALLDWIGRLRKQPFKHVHPGVMHYVQVVAGVLHRHVVAVLRRRQVAEIHHNTCPLAEVTVITVRTGSRP